MKFKLFGEDLFYAIEVGKEISCEPWRWGTSQTFVFERDGKHFMFTARFHYEDGISDGDAVCGVTAVEVRPVEKVVTTTVWELV